jgi:hypothetical protein
MTARSRHVCFTPHSGHSSLQVGCPKSAISRHSPRTGSAPSVAWRGPSDRSPRGAFPPGVTRFGTPQSCPVYSVAPKAMRSQVSDDTGVDLRRGDSDLSVHRRVTSPAATNFPQGGRGPISTDLCSARHLDTPSSPRDQNSCSARSRTDRSTSGSGCCGGNRYRTLAFQ